MFKKILLSLALALTLTTVYASEPASGQGIRSVTIKKEDVGAMWQAPDGTFVVLMRIPEDCTQGELRVYIVPPTEPGVMGCWKIGGTEDADVIITDASGGTVNIPKTWFYVLPQE